MPNLLGENYCSTRTKIVFWRAVQKSGAKYTCDQPIYLTAR